MLQLHPYLKLSHKNHMPQGNFYKMEWDMAVSRQLQSRWHLLGVEWKKKKKKKKKKNLYFVT